MGSRLDQIRDWPILAREARYNANRLAQICKISSRQLRRYFAGKKHQTSHAWLHTLRMRQAAELICDKTSVKETALELGYKAPAHFTHDFTKYFGVPPSKFPRIQQDYHQTI